MSGFPYICVKRVPPHVKGYINKMIIQPAMLYGMETVPVTRSHVKKLEVTEMKMCSWACGHTLRDLCEKRKHQGETEYREHHREVQENATEVHGLATHVGDETKTTYEDRLWRW